MKKFIMFVMVLMLCLGTVAKADLVASYGFNGTLEDCTGNGYDGLEACSPGEETCDPVAYDPEGAPPGGEALLLNGTNCVELPLGDANPLDHTADYSIAMWFKVPELEDPGTILFSSARDMDGDNHSLAVFLDEKDSMIVVDMFWIGAVVGETEGLDDGEWHHLAVVFTEADRVTTIYLDGAVDAYGELYATIPNIEEDTILIGNSLNEEFPAEELGDDPALVGSIAHVALFNEALDAEGVDDAMNDGFACGGVPNPLIIDASDTTVYEPTVLPPLDSEGSFTVCLRNQPEPGADVTVIIDPNGPDGGQGNPDLTLDDNDGSPDYTVTLTFTDGNWDEPQVVSFVAVDDSIPEPEGSGYEDAHRMLASSYYPAHPTDANYVGVKQVKVKVIDNDKANILFSYTPLEETSPRYAVTGPIELFEQGSSPTTQWRNIGISLQTPPTGDDPVKLQVVVEGDENLPLTDPCLPFEEIDDPNGLFFTAENYDTEQIIRIWGNDDAELQVLGEEGEYPYVEGHQNYQAVLVATVVDGGGDDGYQWLVPILDEGEPTGEYETVSMEREIDFDIEDNECGAFGILDMDVGNPNAFTDPNYEDDDGNPLPDCYVDIYDAIEMAIRWLVCTDPQNPSCWE
jgi:hypothetical protein